MSIIKKLFKQRETVVEGQLIFDRPLTVAERWHAMQTVHMVRSLHTLLAGAANRISWSIKQRTNDDVLQVPSALLDSSAGLLFADWMVVGATRMALNTYTRYKLLEDRQETVVISNPNCPLEAAAALVYKIRELERAQAQAYYLAGAHVFAVPVNTTLVTTPDEIAQAREVLQRSIRNAGVGGVEILPSNIEFRQINNKLADFNFGQLSTQLVRELCNLYGIDSSLLNDPDNKTYNNKTEAVRALYVNTVIPYAYQFLRELNNALLLANQLDIVVEIDISNIEPLAEQRQKNVETTLQLYQSGIISIDEARKMLELE